MYLLRFRNFVGDAVAASCRVLTYKDLLKIPSRYLFKVSPAPYYK